MRKLLATAVLTLATLAVATPAAAGGWAVATLDPLVAAPVAGEPFDVGFTILQHGQTPITIPDAAIFVTAADGTTTRFAATPEGPVGHHVATVEVPTAGSFQWVIEGFGTHDLGTLQVGSSGSSTASSGDDGSPWTMPLFVVAAVLAGLGLLDLARGRRVRSTAAA